jgi:arabinan endo-1,5-alpha-L-arabinosidase
VKLVLVGSIVILAAPLAACDAPHPSASMVDSAVAPAVDAPAPAVCSTKISYGKAWLAPSGHVDRFDTIMGEVSWDGVCVDDGANSYAMLSNGFKPYFAGHSACILAFDQTSACLSAAPACTTRIAYGAGWLPPANHPNTYDDVAGRVFGDDSCNNSSTVLSNGFAPHFAASTCPIAWRYEQCGGLYTNPDIPMDCPDPGVLHDGSTYYLSCTSGGAAAAFPIYTSKDLASWTRVGHIFPSGMRPAWASGDFWAPEVHKVGDHYVAYYSARKASDGKLSIGAASAPSPLGPFTDLGAPLIHDANMGLIDVSEFNTTAGTHYVLWKEDGNAIGMPTPIHIQPLTSDGLALQGTRSTLITNDKAWEGAVTEGPFMVEHAGMFYLFYSGNSYANATYAVGVARGSTPTGAMTKPAAPIVVTNGAWVGPGHASVVDAGDQTALVYHAWVAGCVNAPGCGREVLTDLIVWGSDGWPSVPLAPSSTTRPLP